MYCAKDETDLEQNDNNHSSENEEIVKLKELIEALKSEKYQQASDYDNYKKHLDNNQKQIIKYRSSEIITKLLPALEMFDQVLQTKNVSSEVKNWLLGFELINKQIHDALTSEGVTKIISKPGDLFDESIHYSIATEQNSEFKNGCLSKVYNNAYKLHDRLIRPASVVVVNNIKLEKIKSEADNQEHEEENLSQTEQIKSKQKTKKLTKE